VVTAEVAVGVSGTALVFGLSGQIGRVLAPSLLAGGWRLLAVSRQADQQEPGPPGLSWLAGSLEQPPPIRDAVDLVLSLGPLDAFVAWLQRMGLDSGTRIVAIGSTSVRFKANSLAPQELAQARALADAERTLFELAQARQWRVTLLRPTLIYGHGRDTGLGHLAARARRWRLCPLPSGAVGLRQPLHVDDLAEAILASLREPAAVGQGYDLAGGETLPFEAMVRRYLRRHAPAARILRLPWPLFTLGLAVFARLAKKPLGPLDPERLRRDQLADIAGAARDLGFCPRKFEP